MDADKVHIDSDRNRAGTCSSAGAFDPVLPDPVSGGCTEGAGEHAHGIDCPGEGELAVRGDFPPGRVYGRQAGAEGAGTGDSGSGAFEKMETAETEI